MDLVLDSSVVAKLFIEENGSDKANEIMEQSYLNDINILASELIFYEVGNTIWRHLRKEKYNGRDYIDRLYLLNINYIQLTKELAKAAIKLAHDSDITFYDAVHVIVGQEYHSKLVTEDRLLLKMFEEVIDIKEALGLIINSTKY